MDGARVLVVGASSGIGRAFAAAACEAGARVVAAARREGPLADLAASSGCHAVAADACAPAGRDAIVAAARACLDRIDLLLYAPGRADLTRLRDAEPASWQATFDTNVFALNQLLRTVLDDLAPGAIVAALSSEAAHDSRSGLVPYVASKAALEASVRGWQIEHPGLRFSVVSVGATVGTDFGAAFRGPLLGEVMNEWTRRALLPAEFMEADSVGRVLAGVYAAALAHPGVGVERIVLRSPSGPA